VVIALVYTKEIIPVACTVDMRVINREENVLRKQYKLHTLPEVWYMGNETEGLHRICNKIHTENEGVVIHVQLRWLANTHNIRNTTQTGEISASSVVLVVTYIKVACRLVKENLEVPAVWYGVERFRNVDRDSHCKHCWEWGHVESKCSKKPACSY
jgi:hypothetical protein